jgi:hypothetical protein
MRKKIAKGGEPGFAALSRSISADRRNRSKIAKEEI